MKKHSTTAPALTRRSLLGLAAASAATFALAGCDDGASEATQEAAAQVEGAFDAGGAELVISTWGFNSEQKRELVFAPFEQAYNCTITVEEGNNGERLSKIEQRPDAYDVIQLSDYYMEQAIEKGLIAPVDKDALTNLDGIYEKARTPNGEEYGPAFTINRIGIIYDSSVVTEPITSWADLWRDDLAGKVTIPDFSATAGPWMLNVAAAQLGEELSADNAEAAIDKLAEMKGNIVKFFTSSSDVVNMFNQGEVAVAVIQDFSSQTLLESSDSIVWVDSAEGTWGGTNVTDVCAQSKNPELAMAFVNYTLDKNVQQRNVETGDAPTRPDVTLADEQAASLVYGQDQVDSITLPDLKLLLENRDSWQAMWNNVLNTSA